MNKPTILITGCGAPGTVGTLWSLVYNPEERPIRTVGVDMRDEQSGRFLCDAFHSIPPADDSEFIDELVTVCEKEDVDVVLPQVTAELPYLSESRDRFTDIGTQIAVSGDQAIKRANNKQSLASMCEQLSVPSPTTFSVTSWTAFEDAANALGYPGSRVVVKPPVSNGQRGFRIISERRNQKRDFFDKKPDGTRITMEQLHSILGNSFPELLVMEYLPGTEFSVDVFRGDGELAIIPRSRDAIRSGISFQSTVTKEDEIIDYAKRLSEAIDLTYAFGFQFKRSKDGTPTILECNPRIQGTMVASTIAGSNLIYAVVKAALNEDVPDLTTDWGTQFHRYWGGIGVSDTEMTRNIGEGL